MDGLDAVLFDLDGTLAVPAQDVDELLARAFRESGTGRPFRRADVDAVDTAQLPTATSDREFFENLFRAAAGNAGTDLPEADLRALADAYLDAYDPAAVAFRPGAREALSTARERYRVGLVTNGGADTQTAKLDTLGLRGAFDATVYCDPSAGIDPKPDPTPLRMAVEELGVDPRESMLVGDDLGADVAGARAFGMRSTWVPRSDPDPDPEPEPTHVADTMTDVAALLNG